MLPLGKIGGGFGQGERDTRLTRDEQRTMMTLWCLFGSPLMLGAGLTKLDDWTLSLLTNPRVLSMLTPACRPWQLERDECHAVWAAENAQAGERYIALFNLADQPTALSAGLAGIWPGCTGGQELLDRRAAFRPRRRGFRAGAGPRVQGIQGVKRRRGSPPLWSCLRAAMQMLNRDFSP